MASLGVKESSIFRPIGGCQLSANSSQRQHHMAATLRQTTSSSGSLSVSCNTSPGTRKTALASAQMKVTKPAAAGGSVGATVGSFPPAAGHIHLLRTKTHDSPAGQARGLRCREGLLADGSRQRQAAATCAGSRASSLFGGLLQQSKGRGCHRWVCHASAATNGSEASVLLSEDSEHHSSEANGTRSSSSSERAESRSGGSIPEIDSDSHASGKVSIKLQNLSRVLPGGKEILKSVSFEVRPGEFFGLIGRSGSGKSTTLRAINRLWEPPAGSVYLDGVDVTTCNVQALRRRVGMVFQNANLFEGTVADNVAYGPLLQGRHLSLDDLSAVLLRVGLDPSHQFLSRSVRELSGGEAQRVSIARSLANQPAVLLLDEPTSSVDPAGTRIVERTIEALRDEHGLTAVIVSHSIEQIQRLADSCALMEGGTVIAVGLPNEMRDSDDDRVSFFFS